jgi:hypothetical protein
MHVKQTTKSNIRHHPSHRTNLPFAQKGHLNRLASVGRFFVGAACFFPFFAMLRDCLLMFLGALATT